jgi:DNA-binding MarR family transcriptional regulator
MADIVERYSDRILGVLSCYDRVIIRGQIPGFAYVKGMESFLDSRRIKLFDFPRFFMPLRDALRDNAQRLAKEQGIEVQFIRNHEDRKQDIVAEIIKQRGEHPGLVAILSAMETCPTFEPRYDRDAGRPRLRPDRAKCLHYYFYFIDEDLGLCFLRVSTWCPFGLQFYYNGHNALAAKLRKVGIEFSMLDNCFNRISDWDAAQKLADESDTQMLHARLDHYAQLYCPVVHALGLSYQWNLAQVEYSTDIVFRRQLELSPIFEQLVRTAIHAVKPSDVGTFLGRRLVSYNTDDLRNVFHYRIESCCLKHRMGPSSIKMYSKFGIMLRIETTTNDPSWFSHYRTVDHRNGTSSHELAPLKKSIYSLFDFRQLAVAANRRYLAFLSALDDPTVSVEAVGRLSQKVTDAGRSYSGLNFFSEQDSHLFELLVRGEYTIRGLRNTDLRKHLPGKSPGQVSRMLKRLWMHGLIKKVGGTYKYYITDLGRTLATTGLKLKNLVLIPGLARAMAV